jgi:hypothetical protein
VTPSESLYRDVGLIRNPWRLVLKLAIRGASSCDKNTVGKAMLHETRNSANAPCLDPPSV